MRVKLTPNQTLCVGCFQVIEKAFSVTGSIYKGVGFREEEYAETEMIMTSEGLIEAEIIKTRKIPIPNKIKGFICSSCASDYRTREVRKRNGEVTYEPLVQLDTQYVWERNKIGKMVRKPSHSVSLNPGWSREDRTGNPTLQVDRWGFVEEPEVDPQCFNKYGRGRRP